MDDQPFGPELLIERQGSIRIVRINRPEQLNAITGRLHVVLGKVLPADVAVELYHGQLDMDGQLQHGQALEMTPQGAADGDGRVRYVADMPCGRTGLTGYTVRVLPRHQALTDGRDLGLIRWA